MSRKIRLVDCNPTWATESDGQTRYIIFDCPEGHEGCKHSIPFTPSLEGQPTTTPQPNGAHWQRTGDTFETLTLTPSIRRIRRYATREEAIADGRIPEYVDASMLCALHIVITDGQIVFCGDSE